MSRLDKKPFTAEAAEAAEEFNGISRAFRASLMPRFVTKITKTTKFTKGKNTKSLLFLLFVLFVASVISPSAQNQPTFRSTAQVVEVDVRVFDKEGQFASDLEPEDFEVLENGQPQRVETVYLVSERGTVTLSAKADAANTPDAPSSPESVTVPLSARQTWIFVFDLQHITPGGFNRTRDAVRDFIRDRFKDGDMAGVVAGTRMVNNRLTSVRAELVKAVESVQPNSDAQGRQLELTREWPRIQDLYEAFLIADENREAIDRAVQRACIDDPSACRMTPPDMIVREKARRVVTREERSTVETLTALNALASGMARMPGPKTVVFLSNGFVVQRAESMLRGIVGQTARAGARVYAIDVRGLNRGRGSGIIDQQYVDNEMGAFASSDAFEDGANSLAVDTGGMMIRNENNISRALGEIAADANQYYVLGYQPTDAMFDGKFRAIEVKVKRPGMRVRARRGYLALEPAKMLLPRPVTTTPPSNENNAQAGKAASTPAPVGSEAAAPSTVPAAAITTPGTVVSAPSMAGGGAVRLRPDAESRVEALSGGDIAAADSAAKEGWEAYQRGDVNVALPLLEKAAATPGTRPWVIYTLGFSQVAVGKPNDAVASWEKVRQAAPDFEPVYFDLADTYVQLSDLTKALGVLRDAEKRWPSDAQIHNAIGVIYVRRGALDDAVEAFAQAARHAPDDALAYFNLARAYELRYSRGQRYVSSQRRWIAPEEDRQKAIENYQRYLKIGGPYTTQAKEAISRLEWARK